MRIRWRGLELPSRVVRDEAVSTDSYGRFVVEPFEHGFGTTIGNSLRRILLSSIEGAAVVTVKIAGVSHEFCSMDGVVEDVTDVILNIKDIRLTLDSDDVKTMTIRRETAGDVLAGDIEADPAITVVNPDHHLATVTGDVPFHVDMTVRRGRGYKVALENRSADQELGVIALDSVFSPVMRVRYRTEEMRVGQKTNYDRLIMEIWTRGTLKPEDALVEASAILRKHLNPFLMYEELGDETVAVTQVEPEPDTSADDSVLELWNRRTSTLNLSVRASNCLEHARITTIGELVQKTEGDLLRVRSFGKTSLHEVERKLAELGLALGIRLDDDGHPVELKPQSGDQMATYPAPPGSDSIRGGEYAAEEAGSDQPSDPGLNPDHASGDAPPKDLPGNDSAPDAQQQTGEQSADGEQEPTTGGTDQMQVFTMED